MKRFLLIFVNSLGANARVSAKRFLAPFAQLRRLEFSCIAS